MTASTSSPIARLQSAICASITAAHPALGAKNAKGTETVRIMHRLVVGKDLPASGEYGKVGAVWSGSTVLYRNNSRFDGMEQGAIDKVKATEALQAAIKQARAVGVHEPEA